MGKKDAGCCDASQGEAASRVEAVLSVDERGQMVLPKDLRTRAGISPGDKLAVVSHEKDGEICCISLIKAESLTEMVRGVLGPMMKDIIA
ncbi:MAG: HgcAB-associated protein [Actinomycetota bacterium]|nr:HgcAB-associated protein [Actinomycetota bacterium]MDD5666096.1 HgcAB-associated protein [Actinomycetota bacterium]